MVRHNVKDMPGFTGSESCAATNGPEGPKVRELPCAIPEKAQKHLLNKLFTACVTEVMYNYVKDYSGLPFFVQGTLTSNKSGFPCTHAPVLRIAYAKALLKNLGPANATSSSAAICLPRGLALRSECYRTAVVSDAKNVALRNGLGKPRASYVAASICAKPFRKDCESS